MCRRVIGTEIGRRWSNTIGLTKINGFLVSSSSSQCVIQKCRKILVDLELTKCGEFVVFHNQMLNRIGHGSTEATQHSKISSMSLEEIRKLDITENHPLG